MAFKAGTVTYRCIFVAFCLNIVLAVFMCLIKVVASRLSLLGIDVLMYLNNLLASAPYLADAVSFIRGPSTLPRVWGWVQVFEVQVSSCSDPVSGLAGSAVVHLGYVCLSLSSLSGQYPFDAAEAVPCGDVCVPTGVFQFSAEVVQFGWVLHWCLTWEGN